LYVASALLTAMVNVAFVAGIADMWKANRIAGVVCAIGALTIDLFLVGGFLAIIGV